MSKIPITYSQPVDGGSSKVAISRTNRLVENTESPEQDFNKPILATEVFSKLRNIGWGKLDGRFVSGASSDKLWYRRYKYGSDMPEYPIDALNSVANPSDIGFPISFNNTIPISAFVALEDIYSETFGEYESHVNSTIFTETLRSKLVCSNSEYIDVILPDYDIYTNLVNISDLIKYSTKPGIKALIDIVVKFSKKNNNNIYTSSLRFVAFRYEQTGLIQEDLVFDLGEIELSYSNGIIEVIPVSSEIKEYIIDKCTVKYGEF